MFNTEQGHRGLVGVCRSILGINVLSIRVTMWMGRYLASTSDTCGFRISQHQTLAYQLGLPLLTSTSL